MNKKLTYIANIRLPTEKAHSIQIMKMCEAFVSQGVEVELVIPDKKNNLGESEVFGYYGIKKTFKIKRIFSTDLLGRTRFFGKIFYWLDLTIFLIGLYWTVKIERGGIIYGRDPILLAPFLKKRCTILTEIHDIPQHQPFFWWLLKRADGIIAITSHLRNVLVQNGLKVDRITVAADAIDLRDFDAKISQKEARKNINLPQNKKVVMYIGLFDEWKGYRTLLETSLLLPSAIQLVMVGGTSKQLKRLRKEYPWVTFLGFRPYHELAQNQRAADVLIIPNSGQAVISKYFTSPLKLFAHMASGVPIIASDLPSLREIVDESTVFFFTPDNPDSLANTINYVLSNPSDSRKRAERALVRVRQYSWQNRAKKILEFIHV